jgi:acyl-CoA reductase-like NAD-dependent aldehyde dehydrogenase
MEMGQATAGTGIAQSETLKAFSPIDGSLYVERPFASSTEIENALATAKQAQQAWSRVTLDKRMAIAERFIEAFKANADEIAEEITWQMGRPIKYTPGEVRGFEERARYMLSAAKEGLADVRVEGKEGFTRFIRKDPVGVVLVIAPWNYPYLTSVNTVLPAIVAGNAVILKHSHHTPLCAERFAEAWQAAGLPDGVYQYLHLHDSDAEEVIADDRVDYVAFTGSVRVGHKVVDAAKNKFVGIGLELGGKDPAYVREDADLNFAVENLVDGAFFNSGQSCCAIERIYVHEKLYDKFVEGFVALTNKYILGDPRDSETTLGPLVRTSSAEFVRQQIEEAKQAGAKALIDESRFAMSKPGTPYLAPQVLVDVDHSMSVMSEESFGPVVGIMKVSGDAEAIKLMNDSKYGLTASIWTSDLEQAIRIGDRIETGTFFMNRCDYLDPALAWTGVKDSGRGCTLSVLGYDQLTRPKSFHLRTQI